MSIACISPQEGSHVYTLIGTRGGGCGFGVGGGRGSIFMTRSWLAHYPATWAMAHTQALKKNGRMVVVQSTGGAHCQLAGPVVTYFCFCCVVTFISRCCHHHRPAWNALEKTFILWPTPQTCCTLFEKTLWRKSHTLPADPCPWFFVLRCIVFIPKLTTQASVESSWTESYIMAGTAILWHAL